MERFYVITNETKDEEFEVTNRIKHFIESEGKSCILKHECAEEDIPEILKNVECVIVIGGDGTVIQATHETDTFDIPMIGINLGTLGYLTDVEVANIEDALRQLIYGEVAIEKRMMLEGTLPEGRCETALNDIVVGRTGSLRIMNFHVYVNGQLLNSYRADGMIISTPTGSTGYNLSARGPIAQPAASMILLTPICPHALGANSIILADNDVIDIEIGEGRDRGPEEGAITFDGTTIIPLRTGERIHIEKAEKKALFVKLNKISFLETLCKKMKGY